MRHELQRFGALLGKELREHRNLFVITPLVFALLLLLVGYLIVTLAIPAPAEAIILEKAGSLMANLSVRSAVIFPVLLSIPFAPALLLTTIIYLTVCLYQDRKDRSFLFWQSMPVPDWQTVLSRAVTAIFVIPAIFAVFSVFLLSGACALAAAKRLATRSAFGNGQVRAAGAERRRAVLLLRLA